MEKLVAQYCRDIKKRFDAGISTEHSYRADLQNLLEKLVSDVTVTNEPKRQKCGAPDFIIQKKDAPVGYIEAKDVGVDLDRAERSEQLQRYKGSLNNLVLTDYSEFRFIRDGATEKRIKLAEAHDKHFKSLPENFQFFIAHIKDFCSYKSYTIKSAEGLARMMAKKARLMEEVIYNALLMGDRDSSLQAQYNAFKKILIHDLTKRHFADIYAQTIAYGLFAARLHDPTMEDFSREEAMFLVPRSNPFLRQLFSYITGPDLDDRIVWIVNDLADIFRSTDIKELLADFGKSSQQNDPFIHFYETFLAEYDAALRKKKGVYYTPEPVVNFIVRAVDDILQTDFGLSEGLADTSKVEYKVDVPGDTKKVKKQFHKVQILDPAAGTGTFLAEVTKQVHEKFKNQQGIWPSYAEKELIPRLNGFEIMMASYTVCHLKLEMLLRETGYRPRKDDKQQRLRVFLTNSLEEPDADITNIFAHWLSNEAREAGLVKRDAPVMVVLGNPPYSGHSANKGAWIQNLLKDYKQEPGGGPLQEKNSKWLNDDYVKFLRYGQYFIEKNREGVLAFVNNNGFLDNPTFRGMRWSLLKAFDKIYIIDLHGSSKKKDVSPDGSPDNNVFDIQQGVSINIFVRTRNKKRNQLGKVFHVDLYGTRSFKYDYLWSQDLFSIEFAQTKNISPQYFFTNTQFGNQKLYNKSFAINELFKISNSGIVSKRDHLSIKQTQTELWQNIQCLINEPEEDARRKLNLSKDVRDWTFSAAKQDLLDSGPSKNHIKFIGYRPFDTRFIYYTGRSRGFVGWPVPRVSEHLLRSNIALMTNKKIEVGEFKHAFLYKNIVESHAVSLKEINYVFPLYLYFQTDEQKTIPQETERTPNLNSEIITQIAQTLNLKFTPEKENRKDTFAPIDILDYIYAVLYSPTYRETFKEFLKIDFPRVPYPKDAAIFWQLIEYGSQLRKLHLFESPNLSNSPVSYPKEGDNVITRKILKGDFEITDADNQIGRVWINDSQYFAGVPLVAWEFYVGGYQPAQKWLKDRRGRELSYQDTEHYRKIIAALIETDRMMKRIDEVEFL